MKPKENTIEKIDRIYEDLCEFTLPSFDMSLAKSIQQRCHTMNIHKAKVVYFKRIKLILTQVLELARKQQGNPKLDLKSDFKKVESEIRALLDARNG
jgi:hypothetical protein